jgi:large subunit ribosomal protein L5
MAERLLERYKMELIPKLVEKFSFKNALEAPRLNKIVINMGVGSSAQEPKHLDYAMEDLAKITGQRPVATIAKKAEAGFKIRENMKLGCKVTLRGNQMYSFFDKLVNVAIPRIKDFRGLSLKSFDGQGNYAMGLKEQVIFPEIDADKINRSQGMDIVFEIVSQSKDESEELLRLLGMPLREK